MFSLGKSYIWELTIRKEKYAMHLEHASVGSWAFHKYAVNFYYLFANRYYTSSFTSQF